MNDFEELIKQMEGLREQVEALQGAVEQLHAQVCAHGELLLSERVAGLSKPSAAPESPAVLPTLLATGDSPPSTLPGERNRRSTPRHRGNPTPVTISNPQRVPTTFRGWVVDRSPDGLRLVTDEMVPVGTLLKVRPTPDDMASVHWYQVEVRSCQPERASWILGCRFPEKISWSDLRQFG